MKRQRKRANNTKTTSTTYTRTEHCRTRNAYIIFESVFACLCLYIILYYYVSVYIGVCTQNANKTGGKHCGVSANITESHWQNLKLIILYCKIGKNNVECLCVRVCMCSLLVVFCRCLATISIYISYDLYIYAYVNVVWLLFALIFKWLIKRIFTPHFRKEYFNLLPLKLKYSLLLACCEKFSFESSLDRNMKKLEKVHFVYICASYCVIDIQSVCICFTTLYSLRTLRSLSSGLFCQLLPHSVVWHARAKRL